MPAQNRGLIKEFYGVLEAEEAERNIRERHPELGPFLKRKFARLYLPPEMEAEAEKLKQELEARLPVDHPKPPLSLQTEPHGELLRPGEASRRLDINYRTLWYWRKKGIIRQEGYVIFPTRHVRYRREEIERLLHAQPRSNKA